MFYGFDWQNTPSFSRLFSPSVMQRSQGAYNRGMQMFKPYDPAQLEQARQARMQQMAARNQPAPAASPMAGMFLGPDGRVYTKDNLGSYLENNLQNDRSGQRAYVGMRLNPEMVEQLGFKKL